jgi:hypothetical protein
VAPRWLQVNPQKEFLQPEKTILTK